jgi:S-sulfo-L-cysteine synthase (O-acetyl-L-serine-dependent)
MHYKTLDQTIGNTPLVSLRRIETNSVIARDNTLLAKLEGNNPAGSVKDRSAFSMIKNAKDRHQIKDGDVLIEATSGNTGIALAMVAATTGHHIILTMPEDSTMERVKIMRALGAEVILTPKSGGMEQARDLALEMEAQGRGFILNQFENKDNPRAHFDSTGPEIWEQTSGKITHFVSAMGTTGTITGVGQFLKSKNPAIRIIGVQPADGAKIPGIRKWPSDYLPSIFDASVVDELIEVQQNNAEKICRQLAKEEGLLVGASSGGACWVAIQIAQQTKNSTIAFIVCDRGDRYLSTDLFPA